MERVRERATDERDGNRLLWGDKKLNGGGCERSTKAGRREQRTVLGYRHAAERCSGGSPSRRLKSAPQKGASIKFARSPCIFRAPVMHWVQRELCDLVP